MIITAHGRRQSPEEKKKKKVLRTLCATFTSWHSFAVKIAEQVLVVLTLLLCQH